MTASSVTIPLDLDGPTARRFLEYLSVGLQRQKAVVSGSAFFEDDGTFVSESTGQLAVADTTIDLRWVVRQSPDGKICSLQVDSIDATSKDVWESTAQDVVIAALAGALASKTTSYFRRTVVYTMGPNLDGEYWIGGYRIAPAIPEDEMPIGAVIERVLYLDQSVDAIDETQAHLLACNLAHRHAARLSMVIERPLYQKENCHRWVFDPDAGESRRLEIGYVAKEPVPARMPNKRESCRLGRREVSVLEIASILHHQGQLPHETRRIFRAADSGPPKFRHIFDRCSRLYHFALLAGRSYPTVGLAYRVAALDAARSYLGETSVSEFVEKYVGRSDPSIEKISKALWNNIRNAHFHGGLFELGEYEVMDFGAFLQRTAVYRMNLGMQGYEVARRALIAWILREVERQESGKSSDAR